MLTCKHNRVALHQTPLGLYPSELRWMYLKGVLRNFANFTGKHLCRSLFLKNLQAWRSASLLKRDSSTGASLWNLQKLLKTHFFTEHLLWLLLWISKLYFWRLNSFLLKLLKTQYSNSNDSFYRKTPRKRIFNNSFTGYFWKIHIKKHLPWYQFPVTFQAIRFLVI